MALPPHPYWEHQFLRHAGMPTSSGNISFLSSWQAFRSVTGDYNRLDLSQREPGSTRAGRLPNGGYARNYTDTASAAEAFKDQATHADYVALQGALYSQDPFGYSDPQAVAADLHDWGSPRWARAYLSAADAVPAGGGGGGHRPTSKNVGAAWSHLMRTLARDGHRTIVELHKATADLNRIGRRLRRA